VVAMLQICKQSGDGVSTGSLLQVDPKTVRKNLHRKLRSDVQIDCLHGRKAVRDLLRDSPEPKRLAAREQSVQESIKVDDRLPEWHHDNLSRQRGASIDRGRPRQGIPLLKLSDVVRVTT